MARAQTKLDFASSFRCSAADENEKNTDSCYTILQTDVDLNTRLRELPSVDEVLQRLDSECPHDLLVAETRRVLEQMRQRIRAGDSPNLSDIPRQILDQLELLRRPSLRRVINATGVVLHTNLGRAPLGPWHPISGYSNLEFDLCSGKRGKRDAHVGSLIERLLGRPGIVVNNNAAAVYLVLNELAAGFEAIVSRGELIEIGDGFRIPDIMARSGVTLREVGTTNRTRIEDYREAITDRTRLILRVHPSNFRLSGFTEKPALEALSALARERGVPLYEDLGSGCLVNLRQFGVSEPLAAESIKAGVNVVSFSGDKLLGGPQAGFIVGDSDRIARIRRNPMYRAFRVDKLISEALETTLRRTLFCRWDEIPAIRMIAAPASEIRSRAKLLLNRIGALFDAELEPGHSVIGGGSTPEQSIPTWVVAIRPVDVMRFEQALRSGDPAVITRIEDDRVVLDLRTVFPEEEDELAAALQARSR
jgi:L-seryl-tRNA(Ser) seleniumtransferase